jgi:pyrroline-5-carboxylate reductase
MPGPNERLACIAAGVGAGVVLGRLCLPSGSGGVSASPAAAASAGRLGFVGVGTINSAVVRGLCTAEGATPESVVVGPRNAAKAAALVAEFPGLVSQAATNQAVLDASETVFLATPPGPDALREACASLTFRADHTVICLVAGASYELLTEVIAPASTAVIAMPLPPAQVHASTTVMFPLNAEVEALLTPLGTVVPVATFKEAMTVGALGCVMGHFYKHLETVEGWLLANGIDKETAAAATGSYFNTFNQASKEAEPGTFAVRNTPFLHHLTFKSLFCTKTGSGQT